MSNPLLATLQGALGASYTIERELGGGGMARVFLAQERALDRRVVIKVLPPDGAGAVSAERFKREVQVAARLQHPHIVPLLSAGEIDGIPYYTMPFVEGESLRARLGREHELPVPIATRLLRDVADALAYAHGHGVVHRDIKPDNVLLAGSHALVTDFGIAKAVAAARADALGPGVSAESITQIGVALGTPAYMAPEQASADPHVDHRVDVYAIGALAYELLAGRPPFTGHSPQSLLAAVISEEAEPVTSLRPSIPPPLASLVMRCLEKRPADRPQTATEILQALEAQVTPTGLSTAASPGRPRRSRMALGGMALIALAFVGAAVYATQRAPVAASASVITVVPFVPASTDTALRRLGRDLVITVSTNLDGVGAIRATDPFATLSHADELVSAEVAALRAGQFGAGSFVMGSLVREAGRVRVDYSLHAVSGAATLARGSVSGPLDSVSALSDSLTWSLLRQIWRRDRPPTPSVAALTTSSMPALRAYLEGERARGDGRWFDAIAAFDRAIAADSTFWLAYWRNASTRAWMFLPGDTALRRFRQHVDQLPPRDQAILAVSQTTGLSNRIAAYRRVAARFPDAWSAWEESGDDLFHRGPSIGLTQASARTDLERVVSLNPRWTEAWQHLLYIAYLDGDFPGPGADSIVRIMRGFGYDSASAQIFGFSELQMWELGVRLGADTSAIRSPLADSVVNGMQRSQLSPLLSQIVPSFTLSVAGGAAQLAMSRRALQTALPEADAAGYRSAVVWAWASRGAYDSALVAAERLEREGRGIGPSLDVLRVAALAEFSGAVPNAFEPRWNRFTRALPSASRAARIEAQWLRGVAAAMRRDTATLRAASAAMSAIGGDATASFGARELRAFDVELGGDVATAADSLAAIEFEIAEAGLPGFHIAMARAAAARWLQSLGRGDEAERLLRWEEGVIAARGPWMATMMFKPLARLERGRLAEARGDVAAAAQFYRDFIRRYDMPMDAHKPLVAEAKAALERLARNRKGS